MSVDVIPHPIAAHAIHVFGGTSLEHTVAGIWHTILKLVSCAQCRVHFKHDNIHMRKREAEVNQSKSTPDLSPPNMSSGRPCNRAFPMFDRSPKLQVRARDGNVSGARAVIHCRIDVQAKRYSRQVMGRIRLSSLRTRPLLFFRVDQ